MFSFKKLPLILTAAVAAFTLPSTNAQTFCDLLFKVGEDNPDEYNDIFGLIITIDLATGNDLCAELETGGPYTLFAPNNDAIDTLNQTIVEAIGLEPSDECIADFNEQVFGILKYHLINDKIFKDEILLGLDVFDIGFIKTLDDDKLLNFTADGNDKDVNINGDTKIIDPDLDDDETGKHIICLCLLIAIPSCVSFLKYKGYDIATLQVLSMASTKFFFRQISNYLPVAFHHFVTISIPLMMVISPSCLGPWKKLISAKPSKELFLHQMTKHLEPFQKM